MPNIVIDGPKLEKQVKAKLVEEITDSVNRLTGIPREHIVVLIKENDPENVGVGGKLLSER